MQEQYLRENCIPDCYWSQQLFLIQPPSCSIKQIKVPKEKKKKKKNKAVVITDQVVLINPSHDSGLYSETPKISPLSSFCLADKSMNVDCCIYVLRPVFRNIECIYKVLHLFNSVNAKQLKSSSSLVMHFTLMKKFKLSYARF